MQWRERQCGDGGRAIRVRDNGAGPAAISALCVDHTSVIGIQFRNQQRHVGEHTVILRVAQYDSSCVSERELCITRH